MSQAWLFMQERKGGSALENDGTRLLSVGIDVGTSTSQIIFSHLTLANTSGYFSVPSVEITDKKVVYQSPVYRTPLVDGSLIDIAALSEIVEKEYRTAGVDVSQVGTGAVIITGESARKENAKAVLEELSRFAGDFVVSTAGPDLESVIAGQGSGAARWSDETGALTVNLDIGGGTTNLALFDYGDTVGKGCVDIGGRQVIIGNGGRITYVSPSAAKICAARGIALKEGDAADAGTLSRLCDAMAELLEELLGISEETPLLRAVETGGSTRFRLPEGRKLKYVFFSGGVADCIYRTGQDPFAYGDIGVLLGESIRRSRIFTAFRVIESEETIRATVIGAGTYTTSVSGSTITYAGDLFPMKNVPVLKLTAAEEREAWNGNRQLVAERIRWFRTQSDAPRIILAIEGQRDPEYTAMKRLADTLVLGMADALPPDAPFLLVVREDIAKALGQLMRQRARTPGEDGGSGMRRPVIALDAIKVEQGNYVDFGNPIMGGLVIPVVVKTLIFG